jgi:hypothetical protein
LRAEVRSSRSRCMTLLPDGYVLLFVICAILW